MSHRVVLGLFGESAQAAQAARALRAAGVPREGVSVVARTHDAEGVIAEAADASPGAELEDSVVATRLGELGAYLIAAISLVVPGVGPVIADGPLAAEMGEAAGHLAGGVARVLEQAGLPEAEAEAWQQQVEGGAFFLGAHVADADVASARAALEANGATQVSVGTWA